MSPVVRLLLAAAFALLAVGSGPSRAEAAVSLGVAGTPEQVADLQAQGLPVSIRATFEAWSLDRTPEGALDNARALGARPMITWEPWAPTTSGTPNAGQRRYSNRAIAKGLRDDYIRRFARTLRKHDGVVFLRLAHEMNGTWYSWSFQRSDYPRMWRHVWRVFRQEKATNVRFVWSVNPNTFQTDAEFDAGVRRAWPGKRYVDYVGSSLIRFRTQGPQGLAWSLRRLERLRTFDRPMMLTEVKVDLEEAAEWMHGLRCALADRPWIRSVIWSETPSRLAERDPRVGNMNWSLRDQPALRAELAAAAAGAAC